MDIQSECVPCRRDDHERCREALALYGLDVPCQCWIHDHYGLCAEEPDDPAPDDDRADAEQRRYERAIYRAG